MLQFPPMPTWDSLHPLIIHFPIALLLLCPVFIAISAAIKPPKGRPYMIAALLVLLLGTVSLFIAASTGEAASELAERGGAMSAVLESHEALASQTKFVFLGLSAILLGMFVTPRVLRRDETRLFSTLLPLAFLALYSVGVLFLVNTAHDGGRLVHEFGVHAMLPAHGGQTTTLPPAAESSAVPEDKD
jgi:uncharacterized membrane protein